MEQRENQAKAHTQATRGHTAIMLCQQRGNLICGLEFQEAGQQLDLTVEFKMLATQNWCISKTGWHQCTPS